MLSLGISLAPIALATGVDAIVAVDGVEVVEAPAGVC